jgi:hypothetical protein
MSTFGGTSTTPLPPKTKKSQLAKTNQLELFASRISTWKVSSWQRTCNKLGTHQDFLQRYTTYLWLVWVHPTKNLNLLQKAKKTFPWEISNLCVVLVPSGWYFHPCQKSLDGGRVLPFLWSSESRMWNQF